VTPTSSQALVEAQERLRRNEELYRHVIDLSGLTPWTSNALGEILTVGERWTTWTGGPIADALGHGWLQWVHPDDQRDFIPAWETALQSENRFEVEYRIRFRNGEYRWCHARTTKHCATPDDEPIWYGTLEDCHDRHLAAEAFRRTQEELIHVSRLSAMGAMASAIAHEINQPLTAIGNYIRGSKRLSAQLEGPDKRAMVAALDDDLLNLDPIDENWAMIV
jgi:two-component system, LuxR family, sensor kinase FixL